MRRLLLLLALLSASPVAAQNLQGAPVWPGVTLPTFSLPSINGANITPALVGVDASTCAAPGIYLKTATTTGIAFTTTPSVILCVNGAAILTSTASAVTSGVPYVGPAGSASATTFNFGTAGTGLYQSLNDIAMAVSGIRTHLWGSTTYSILSDSGELRFGVAEDVSLSRGAAGALVNSGSFRTTALGVGVANTTAGTIQTTGNITSGGDVTVERNSLLRFGADRSLISAPANGQLNLTNLLVTAGIGLDFATDGTLKVRNRAQNADAAIVSSTAQTTATTVGALPTCNAGAAGTRSFVTDSNAVSFTAGIGSVVAAGGATAVPVVCDGTNWRIG